MLQTIKDGRPDAPSPLFTITSLERVWLAANAYQRDLAAIHPGVALRFTTDALPNRSFDATVTYVAGTLDPQTRTALVRATIPNADHALRPLEVGTAHVLAPTATPLLTVPTRALITHGTNTVVYVELSRGRYARRPVSVGEDDGQTAVILSGLSPADRVVAVEVRSALLELCEVFDRSQRTLRTVYLLVEHPPKARGIEPETPSLRPTIRC